MEIIIGALAAWGLIMLLWTLAGLLFLPLSRRRNLRLSVFVRGTGELPELWWYVRGLRWLRELGLVWWDIVILEDSLESETRRIARKLSEQEQAVEVLSLEQLKDWLD